MKDLVIKEVKRDIMCDTAGCTNKRHYAVRRTGAGSMIYLCDDCISAIAAFGASLEKQEKAKMPEEPAEQPAGRAETPEGPKRKAGRKAS